MRINGSKPKSKNTMLKKKKRKKNLQVATPGFEPATQPPHKPACNWAMRPLHKDPLKLIALKPSNIFVCHSHCLNFVEVFYHEFKYTFEEKWLKRVFQSRFALSPSSFTLRLYNGRSMNIVVFFVALTEVQVFFLSVNKNLPRQGFRALVASGNVVFTVCSYLSQKYLAIRQRTCSKQRKKILSVANQLCCLENENAR